MSEKQAEPLKGKRFDILSCDEFDNNYIENGNYVYSWDIKKAVEWLKIQINSRHYRTGVSAQETRDVFSEINKAFEDVIDDEDDK